MFRADPDAYAPQYGGYCAYAVASGDTASADPELWTIHGGKLNLNYNRRTNSEFKSELDSFIQRADSL